MSIVASAPVAVNTPPTFTVAPTPRDLYWQGFDAYCNRLPLSACATEHERRGWHAANKAEAEASMPGYADKMGW